MNQGVAARTETAHKPWPAVLAAPAAVDGIMVQISADAVADR
jgi:hypothetical protein